MSADGGALVEALKARIDDLALTLLGTPNRLLSNKSSWRYGRNGSLVIELDGNRRGVWFSHEDGEGGGPIQLVMREQGLDTAGAFAFARQWLGGSFQAGDSRIPKAGQRPAPAPANDNGAAGETPKEDPAAYARRIWAGSIPITRTCAERYLREHRGITGELPDNLRMASVWHKEAERSFPALIVPAFWPDGTLARVQAVYLDPTTGAKASLPAGCKVKKTFGTGASHVPAVLPGAPGGAFDVLLTEGVEDALSLRFALEAGDVATTLGAGCLHKPEIVPGTRVCLVADNDAAGIKATQKAAAEHTMRGCHVWIATPPPGIKDANALLMKQGPAAVRAMVEEAERFQPAPANGAVVAAFSADEASERTRSAIARTLYLCDYLSNSLFQAEILDLLNQGEAVHSLQRAIHCTKWTHKCVNGPITAKRGRTTEQLSAISGALTLLANIVMAWNTHRLQNVLKRPSADYPDEVLSEIAPIGHKHINLRGILTFDLTRHGPSLLDRIAFVGRNRTSNSKS